MHGRALAGVVVVYLLGIAKGVAQDPMNVAPTHYKLGFENEHVQVVYIHYGPHEKSVLHSHPSGVVINLTNGYLRFVDQDGKAQEVRAIHGEARWFHGFRHQVENLSDTSYDGVYIAVKSAARASIAEPVGFEGLSQTDLAVVAAASLLRDLPARRRRQRKSAIAQVQHSEANMRAGSIENKPSSAP